MDTFKYKGMEGEDAQEAKNMDSKGKKENKEHYRSNEKTQNAMSVGMMRSKMGKEYEKTVQNSEEALLKDFANRDITQNTMCIKAFIYGVDSLSTAITELVFKDADSKKEALKMVDDLSQEQMKIMAVVSMVEASSRCLHQERMDREEKEMRMSLKVEDKTKNK